jgi:hypothetical protein
VGDVSELVLAAAVVEVGDAAEVEPGAAVVEVGDVAEVEPGAAVVEVGDAAEVEPGAAVVEVRDVAVLGLAAADVGDADAVPAGPQYDDEVKMPEVPALSSGGRQQRHPVPEQPVLGPAPVQTPTEKRRFGSLAVAAIALAALLIGALLFAATRDRDLTAQSVPSVTATATATATKPTNAPSNQSTIQLENLPESARPSETVRLHGTYRGGADTFLQVQRWEGGKWLAFPVPTKTDQSGAFTAYVELEQPGRYRLRVVHPGSGVASKPFVLMIKG